MVGTMTSLNGSQTRFSDVNRKSGMLKIYNIDCSFNSISVPVPNPDPIIGSGYDPVD